MPRGLSLKKAPRPSKEQPTITAFFKNVAERKLASDHLVTTEEPVKTAKRKATSPISNNPNKLTADALNKGNNHDSEHRVRLVEILDSPSNSPPSLKGFDARSNSDLKNVNTFKLGSENKEKSDVIVIDDSHTSNLQLRRSPRKLELKKSSVLLSSSKCKKNISLRKDATCELKRNNKNVNNDTLLPAISSSKVMNNGSVNENNIPNHLTTLKKNVDKSQLQIKENCILGVLKQSPKKYVSESKIKEIISDSFDESFSNEKDLDTPKKHTIMTLCLSPLKCSNTIECKENNHESPLKTIELRKNNHITPQKTDEIRRNNNLSQKINNVQKYTGILSQTANSKITLSSPKTNEPVIAPRRSPRKLNFVISPANELIEKKIKKANDHESEEMGVNRKTTADAEIDSMFGDEWSMNDITSLSSATAQIVYEPSIKSIEFKNKNQVSPQRTTKSVDDTRASPRKTKYLRKNSSATEQTSVNNTITDRKMNERKMSPQRSPRKLNVDSSPAQNIIEAEEMSLINGNISEKLDLNNKVKDEKNVEADLMFGDEWSVDDVEETVEVEDLDLSMWQRCEVIKVMLLSDNCSEIKLKDSKEKLATCRVEGIWNSLPLRTGDIVSVQAVRRPDSSWLVSDCGGLLVLRPDVLLSSTAVVGAVFCRRKAVLQERFKGLDCGNKAMTIGILVHELLQLSLQQRLCSVPAVRRACETLLSSAQTVRLLYDAEMSCEEARDEMNTFVPHVVRFVDEHVVNSKGGGKGRKADEWGGRVESVLDIEENICCPQLGVKGKIDVTLQVNIHNRKGYSELAPLELKTGRASVSAEHRGQLILYMMMMSLQQGREVAQGLLLYLRDMITLKVVTSGYPEKRDLLMLRNQLAQYLTPKTRSKRSKSDDCASNATEMEEVRGSALDNVELPEPINHHACGKCAYLTLCSLYQWNTDSTPLSENHILSKLRSEALGHLSESHVQYFLRWTALLLLEDLEKSVQGPLHHIWTMSPQERELRGQCLSDLRVSQVHLSGERFLHTFKRPLKQQNMSDKEKSVMSVGSYIVVSTEGKVCVAAGIVTQLDYDVICVALERDLTVRNAKDTLYHIDAYESQSQLMFNFTNLGVLMDNDEKSNRLRSLIIDRTPGTFAARLPREVGRVGARLLKSLNLVQQRAVLRAVAADHYTLIHGMPGTGKTQTVVVLVQMLVALGQRVIVTAHTHSAVDNVLQRLPSSMRVLRLGSTARVSALLARCSEDTLTAHCNTPDELRHLYNSMEVVGVTCLGAGHSLLSKTQFDVCVVDESTQVVQSTVLRPLFSARRFVLVGDPEQLPPVVRSPLARKLGMDESAFARLHGSDASVSLSAQYRMNARVASLANRFTYQGELTCANDDVKNAHINVDFQKIMEQYSSTQPWLVDCLSPSIDKSVLLLDTGCTAGWAPLGAEAGKQMGGAASAQIEGIANAQVGSVSSAQVVEFTNTQNTSVLSTSKKTEERESKYVMNNLAEAVVVMALVKALFQAGLHSDSIGIITPYRDQVILLKKCVTSLQKSLTGDRRRSPRKNGNATMHNVTDVEVNTVDQYQGRDKSVIIYSCCKTWDSNKGDYTVKDSEILEDKRRLTVAITRAKHKLILLGDVRVLRHYSTFSQLFKCLHEIDREGSTNSVIDLKRPYDELYESFGLVL